MATRGLISSLFVGIWIAFSLADCSSFPRKSFTREQQDVAGIPGSIEYFMGNWNIHERTSGQFPNTHALIQAYTRGDPYARQVWARSSWAAA